MIVEARANRCDLLRKLLPVIVWHSLALIRVLSSEFATGLSDVLHNIFEINSDYLD